MDARQPREYCSRKHEECNGCTSPMQSMRDLVVCHKCQNRLNSFGSAPRWFPWKNGRLPLTLTVTMVLCCLLLLATPSLAIQKVQVDNELDDIREYLPMLGEEVVDVGNEKTQSDSKQPVTVKWGIPDTVANVGKLFHYMLPDDAFSGDITSYMVSIFCVCYLFTILLSVVLIFKLHDDLPKPLQVIPTTFQ